MEIFEPDATTTPAFGGDGSTNPFAPPRSDEDGPISEAVDLVTQFGQGFLQGFSTLPVGSEPETLWQGIARNTGHLMGFVGVIPFVGPLGSLASRGVMKGVGLTAAGLKTTQAGSAAVKAIQGSSFAQRAGQAVSSARFSSVPFLFANGAEKYATQAVRTAVGESTWKAWQASKAGRIGVEASRQALQLGTASAVSHWTEGVDRMMGAFAWGAVEGGVFQGIASIPGFASKIADGTRPLDTGLVSTLMRGNVREEIAPLAARSLASSLYDGGISTYMGDPLELQVYNYLLGAYFGVKDVSADQMQALRYMQGVRQEHGYKAGWLFGRPERIPESDNYMRFGDLSEVAQAEVRHEAEQRYVRYTSTQDGPLQKLTGTGKLSDVELLFARAAEMHMVDRRESGDYDQERVDELVENGLTEDEAIYEVLRDDALDMFVDKTLEDMSFETVGVETPDVPSPNAAQELAREEIKHAEPPLVSPDEHMARVRSQFQLEEAWRNHEKATPLRNPLSKATDIIRGALDEDVYRQDVERALIEESGRFLQRVRGAEDEPDVSMRSYARLNGPNAYHSYAAFLDRNFLAPVGQPLERGSELDQSLRQAWNRMMHFRVKPQMAFVEDGSVRNITARDAAGNDRLKREPPTFMERQLRRYHLEQGADHQHEVVEVAQAEVTNQREGSDNFGERESVRLFEAMESPDYELSRGQLFENMARAGLYPVGGAKDKGSMFFARDLMEGEEDVQTTIRSALDALASVREETMPRVEPEAAPERIRGVQGMGETLATRLEETFGEDLSGVRIDDLLEVPGMGPARAERVVAALRESGEAPPDPRRAYEEGAQRAQEEGMSRATYDRSVANAIRRYEIMNGGETADGRFERADFGQLMRENATLRADFISDPQTLNKRYQLYHAGEVPLSPRDMVEAGVRDMQRPTPPEREDPIPSLMQAQRDLMRADLSAGAPLRDAPDPDLQRTVTERFGDASTVREALGRVGERSDAYGQLARYLQGRIGETPFRLSEDLVSNRNGRPIAGVLRANGVTINPARIAQFEGSSTTFADHVVLHEAVHSLTSEALTRGRSRYDEAFDNTIGRLRSRALDEIDGFEAAFVNNREFLSFALTSPAFQERLMRVRETGVDKQRTFFGRVKQTVKDFIARLGGEPAGGRSVLDETFEALFDFAGRPGREGTPGEGMLRGAIVADENVAFDRLPTIEGQRPLERAEGEAWPNGTDGAVLVRPDVADGIAMAGGVDMGAGSYKGIQMHSTTGEGGLIGKYAYHVADEGLARYMQEEGLHFIQMRSAAKQVGRRPTAQWTATPDGQHRITPLEGSGRPFVDVPVSSFTVNPSSSESVRKAREDKPLMKQAHLHLPPDVVEPFLERYVRPEVEGRPAQSARIDEYRQLTEERPDAGAARQEEIDARREALRAEIKEEGWRRVGLQPLLDILVNGDLPATRLYADALTHVLDQEERHDLYAPEEEQRPDYLEQYADYLDTKSAAERILELWPKTPFTAHYKLNRNYVESTIRAYVEDRILRPQTDHSWSSVMTPYDPGQRLVAQEQLGRDLEPGETLVGEALRDKEIRWGKEGGETLPLGEAWTRFQRAGGWEGAPPWMQDHMTVAAIRVPADSLSGTRVLKIMGFTGRRGAGMTFHPKDMEYMGGADLDIDKANAVYQDLPREMMDAYRAAQDQFEEGGQFVPAKNERQQERFRGAPDPADLRQEGPFGMLDPLSITEWGSKVYGSNRALGYALSAANKGIVLQRRLDADGLGGARWPQLTPKVGESPTYIPRGVRERWAAEGRWPTDEEGAPRPGMWNARLAGDEGRELRASARAAVNFYADAEPGLVGRQEAQQRVLDAYFTDRRVYYVDENDRAQRADDISSQEIDPRWNNDYRALSQLDRAFSKYGYKEASPTLEKVWATATEASADVSVALRGDVPSTYFRAIQEGVQRVSVDPARTRRIEEDTAHSQRVGQFIGDGFVRVVELYNDLLEPGDPVAQAISRMAVRTAGGAPVGLRVGPNTATNEEQQIDFPINDLSDITTAAMLYETGRLIQQNRPDLGPNQLADQLLEIGQFIARTKDKESPDMTAEDREAITRELREYYDDLDGAFRPWFEQYLIGSLYPQEKAFTSMAGYQKIQQQIQREKGAADPDEAKLESLEAQREAFINEWYRSSTASSFMTAQDVVSPAAIQRFGERINQLAQLTWKDNVSSEEVERVLMRHPTGGGEALRQLQEGADRVNTKTREPLQADRFVTRLEQHIGEIGEGTLGAEAEQLAQRLARIMDHYPQIADNLPVAFSGIVAQGRFIEEAPTLGTATKEDIREFLTTMEGAADRSLVSQIKGRLEEGLPLRWHHWFMFPKAIDERMRRYDMNLFIRPGKVLEGMTDEGEIREEFRPVMMTMSHFGAIAEVHKTAARMEDNENARWERLVERKTGWRRMLGDDAETIESIAWRLREEGARGAGYAERAQAAREELAALEAKGKRYEVTLRGEDETRIMTPREAVELMQTRYRELIETAWGQYIFSEDNWNRLVDNEAYRREDGTLQYERLTDDLIEEVVAFEEGLRHEEGNTAFPSFDVVSRLAREQMLRKVEVERPPVTSAQAERLGGYVRYVRGEDQRRSASELREDRIVRAIANGQREAPDEIREAATALLSEGERVLVKDLPPEQQATVRSSLEKKYDSLRFQQTRNISFDHYMPHNGHPSPVLRDAKRQRLAAQAKRNGTEIDKARAEMEVELEMGRQMKPDGGLSEDVTRMLEIARLSESDLETGGLTHRPGHLRSRGTSTGRAEGPMKGYEQSSRAIARYGKQLISGQRKVLASLLSHRLIERFEASGVGGSETRPWSVFMRAYNRDNLGYPSLFPEEWLSAVEGRMGPYKWFTDQGLQQLADRMGKALGYEGSWLDGRTRLVREIEALQEELEAAETNAEERALRREIGEKMRQREQKDELWGHKLQRLSQYEGQFQLLTLLSNTRTMVNNLFGGSQNTIVSAGWQPFRKAGSTQYLQQHVNPNWEGRDDVNAFREQHGAVENYIINEIQFNNWLPAGDMSRFRDDLAALVRRRKEASERPGSYYEKEGFTRGLRDLMRDYGIMDAAMNAGGVFMRKTERILRGQAWMAHYVRAREALGMSGTAFPPDHPWVIRMANKGVEATQFVYNNAARPAFARTSLGRIFSRFQLWAWNSVRFRREIFQEAQRQGFQQGSESFGRLQRMMTSDLFIIGLAQMFPFSLFDSSVAPPFDWAVETAEWAFGGDDDEREAFYGSPLGPAEIISPPAFRFATDLGDVSEDLDGLFRFMTTGDWSDLSAQTIATWFPFGRLTRDMGRVVSSPLGAPKTITGFPVWQLEGAVNSPPQVPVRTGADGPVDRGLLSGGERIPTFDDEPITTFDE